jgi:hypothetical protein
MEALLFEHIFPNRKVKVFNQFRFTTPKLILPAEKAITQYDNLIKKKKLSYPNRH